MQSNDADHNGCPPWGEHLDRNEERDSAMKTFSWRTGSLIALILAIGGATAYASHSWGGYHWARTSNPFTLKVGDNVSSAWDPYLNEAIADWSASSVLNLVKVTGGAKAASVPAHRRTDRGLQRALWQHRLARHRADLAQRIPHHAGHHQAQRHLLQHRHLQHAGVAAAGDVPGNCARLRPRSPGRRLRQPEPRDVHGLHQQPVSEPAPECA